MMLATSSWVDGETEAATVGVKKRSRRSKKTTEKTLLHALQRRRGRDAFTVFWSATRKHGDEHGRQAMIASSAANSKSCLLSGRGQGSMLLFWSKGREGWMLPLMPQRRLSRWYGMEGGV
jgi:hypothetical protein